MVGTEEEEDELLVETPFDTSFWIIVGLGGKNEVFSKGLLVDRSAMLFDKIESFS